MGIKSNNISIPAILRVLFFDFRNEFIGFATLHDD